LACLVDWVPDHRLVVYLVAFLNAEALVKGEAIIFTKRAVFKILATLAVGGAGNTGIEYLVLIEVSTWAGYQFAFGSGVHVLVSTWANGMVLMGGRV
jgi:hypothetical protein